MHKVIHVRITKGERPLKSLERVFSKAGVASRSEARSWISGGRVRVNGKSIRNPDYWVDLERDRELWTISLCVKPASDISCFINRKGI